MTLDVVRLPLSLSLYDPIKSGWTRHLGWSPGDERSDDAAEEATSVADRLAVVLQVARKVQNQLGAVCDAAEKIKK